MNYKLIFLCVCCMYCHSIFSTHFAPLNFNIVTQELPSQPIMDYIVMDNKKIFFTHNQENYKFSLYYTYTPYFQWIEAILGRQLIGALQKKQWEEAFDISQKFYFILPINNRMYYRTICILQGIVMEYGYDMPDQYFRKLEIFANNFCIDYLKYNHNNINAYMLINIFKINCNLIMYKNQHGSYPDTYSFIQTHNMPKIYFSYMKSGDKIYYLLRISLKTGKDEYFFVSPIIAIRRDFNGKVTFYEYDSDPLSLTIDITQYSDKFKEKYGEKFIFLENSLK